MSHQYINKISKPINDSSPVGERLHDDALFDFVESQLMKVGSLSHSQVQWSEVESSVVTLLDSRTKDLKLMVYLLQCLQREPSIDNFSLSLECLKTFMAHYWETCFPAPGPRGVLPRRKYFAQIVLRTIKAGEGLQSQSGDPDGKAQLLDSLNALIETASGLELPVDTLEVLQTRLKRQFEQQKQQAPANNMSATRSTSLEQVAQGAPQLDIDSTSDKATKQTLLKVADFIGEFETGTELSLKIRRFATWLAVSSVPENANATGETSLMPISADRIGEYESLLETDASLSLLRRVEQSLTLSPFWLDGHHLSARIAVALGQDDWARAIHQDTRDFVTRLSKLLSMSFKGGVPFANTATQDWLAQGYDQINDHAPRGGAIPEQDILALAESGGLSVAFASLNDHLSQASSPRDSFYLRVLAADLKHRHQLGVMADIDYQILHEQASRTTLADWEPSLLARLKQKANLD